MRRVLTIVAAVIMAVFAAAGAASAAIPAGAHTTTNPDGGFDIGGVHINNKVFDSRIHQELWATSASHFGVVATAPRGNTAVLSYPSRQDLEYLPISRLKALLSTYSYTLPSAGDFEAAYDIWVQPNGQTQNWDKDIEVMIWTQNHGQTPAGKVVGQAVTQYDQRFTVWLAGGKGKGDSTVTLVLNNPGNSGTMHILSVFRWLIAAGYFPARSALLDVENGWEICSTGGGPEQFTMNSYTLQRKI